jgi:hypothetical protein
VKIAWEKELHVMENYHIWQEGQGVNGGAEKKIQVDM